MSKITTKKVLKWGLISGTLIGIGYFLGNKNARKTVKNTGLSAATAVKEAMSKKKETSDTFQDLPKHEPARNIEKGEMTSTYTGKPKYEKFNKNNNQQ